MFDFLATRRHQAEMLDEPDADQGDLIKSLRYIRVINRLLGYDRLVVNHLKQFSAGWKAGQVIRVLDVGTGSADIPRRILKWGTQHGWDIRVVAIDLHERIALEAQRAAKGERQLSIVRADALRLPFEDNAFDYATTSMFLHHLTETKVEQVLREMDRVSRRGIIASDLLRLRRSYAFIRLATLLANPMVRHDARVSIEQAFTQAEVIAMRDRAGVSYAAYHNHMTHRFVLSGEKRPANFQ